MAYSSHHAVRYRSGARAGSVREMRRKTELTQERVMREVDALIKECVRLKKAYLTQNQLDQRQILARLSAALLTLSASANLGPAIPVLDVDDGQHRFKLHLVGIDGRANHFKTEAC
jgi:hypothetical protein